MIYRIHRQESLFWQWQTELRFGYFLVKRICLSNAGELVDRAACTEPNETSSYAAQHQEIKYVLAWECSVTVRGKSYPAETGDVLCHRCSVLKHGDPTDLWWVCCSGRSLWGVWERQVWILHVHRILELHSDTPGVDHVSVRLVALPRAVRAKKWLQCFIYPSRCLHALNKACSLLCSAEGS